MPDSNRVTSPSRAVAWGLAMAAAPLVVLGLRTMPATSVAAASWLPPAAYALVAVMAAAAAARWLAETIRAGDLRAALLAASAATIATSAAVATLAGSLPPPIPIGLGLAGAGVAAAAATGLADGIRVGWGWLAAGIFAASVAILATALFVPWPDPAGPALAGIAAGVLAGAALLGAARGAEGAGPLLVLAGGAAALGLARAGSGEGVVALVPVMAGSLLLAVERRRGGEPGVAGIRDGEPARPALPALAHDLAEGVLLLDRDGRILDWNVAAASLLELRPQPRGQLAAETLAPLIGDVAWRGLMMPAAGTQGRAQTERGRPLELTMASGGDLGEDAILLLVRDLSLERGEATEAGRLARELRGTIEELLDARRTVDLQRAELERASLVDALTGTASRRTFLERLATETAQGRRYSHPVALVVIDIDGFSSLNRTHGLATGDAVLRELALRLRLRMRDADALGRLGGDCFGAILPHTDERGAAVFADAVLRRMISRPVETEAGPLTVTVSLGVALMRAGMDLDDEGLLAAADEALASARRGGGNRIAFDRRHGLVRLEERHRPGGDAERSVADADISDTGA